MKPSFLAVLLLVSGLLSAAPTTVQVKEASVYEKPSVISKFLGKVTYGTVLTVLATQEGWVQIKATNPALTGWLRDQSVTSKKVALVSGGEASGPSDTEVSLAGRGFTEEVEKGYKAKNPDLDFADVDKMEAMGIDEGQLEMFLKDGGVVPPGKK